MVPVLLGFSVGGAAREMNRQVRQAGDVSRGTQSVGRVGRASPREVLSLEKDNVCRNLKDE